MHARERKEEKKEKKKEKNYHHIRVVHEDFRRKRVRQGRFQHNRELVKRKAILVHFLDIVPDSFLDRGVNENGVVCDRD